MPPPAFGDYSVWEIDAPRARVPRQPLLVMYLNHLLLLSIPHHHPSAVRQRFSHHPSALHHDFTNPALPLLTPLQPNTLRPFLATLQPPSLAPTSPIPPLPLCNCFNNRSLPRGINSPGLPLGNRLLYLHPPSGNNSVAPSCWKQLPRPSSFICSSSKLSSQ